MYTLLRAQVQSLVEEIRSHKPGSVAKKKRKQHFLNHSSLLHSTSCVTVCVCQCLQIVIQKYNANAMKIDYEVNLQVS